MEYVFSQPRLNRASHTRNIAMAISVAIHEDRVKISLTSGQCKGTNGQLNALCLSYNQELVCVTSPRRLRYVTCCRVRQLAAGLSRSGRADAALWRHSFVRRVVSDVTVTVQTRRMANILHSYTEKYNLYWSEVVETSVWSSWISAPVGMASFFDVRYTVQPWLAEKVLRKPGQSSACLSRGSILRVGIGVRTSVVC